MPSADIAKMQQRRWLEPGRLWVRNLITPKVSRPLREVLGRRPGDVQTTVTFT